MKKIYLLLFIVLCIKGNIKSQVVDRFGSNFTGTPVSYTFTSTDVAYFNAVGGTFSTSGSNLCSSALRRTQVSSIILQLVSSSAGSIAINGTSSGTTVRNLSLIETATTLNGTYTTITGWTAPSTITTSATTCGTISITGINIAIGSFVRFTFSGNVNVSGFDITSSCSNPVITSQPSSPAAVCSATGSTTCSVSATGTTLTYKWQEWAGSAWNNITDGGIYSGSTSTTLTLTNPTNTLNGYKYRCNVTSGGSCTVATDGAATLTVNTAPNISSQSTAEASYGQGFASPFPLTVTASGSGITYQWYSSTDAVNNTFGDDITLGTSNSLSPSTAVIGTLYYYCVVSGTCPAAVKTTISGAINIVTACTAPIFSIQPTPNQTECIGGALSLGTVAADQSPTYQWYSNTSLSNTGGTTVGSSNGGATDTYTPSSAIRGTYYYYCVAANGACPATSNAVQITIDAPAISSQSSIAATYSINGTANPLSVTASGAGLLYQWYSSTDAVSTTSGDDIALGTSSSYTPLTTALGTLYYYCVVSGSCPSAVTSGISGAITISQFQTGDYKSVASANWGTYTTWQKWNGTGWVATASGDFPNSATASVFIQGGFVVNNEASARSVKNIYVSGNSTLKTSNLVNAPIYMRIYGSAISVETGSLIGNLVAGNSADGISLDVFTTSLTITGGGGTINLSRIRTNTAGTTIEIDNDVTLNYHGSTNAGNAAGFYTVAGTNNILTIKAAKTLTFAPWSCFTPVSSSHTNGTLNQTINVNGILNFMDGLSSGNNTANGWSGHTNGYFSSGVTGATFTINIGATGKFNASEFYPNGTQSNNTPGTGDLISINIASGGELNVSKIADLRKPLQIVSDAGAFNLASGANMRIGSAEGITAASALGNIQTGTRGFSTGANYFFDGTAAQVSGDGLPLSVNDLSSNNALGLNLSTSTTVNGILNLTTGTLTTGSNNLSLGSSATAVFNAASRLLISGGTTDFNNRPVTFKSDNTGSASLGQITGTLSNATNVTVERYIRNNGFRSWRLLSVPTYGTQTINAAWQEGNTPMGNNTPGYGTVVSGTTTALGFDDVSNYPGMLSFNGTNFVGIPRTTIPISTNKAYFLYVRGDRTEGVGSSTTANTSTILRTNGTLYQGTQTSDVIPANSYALIGNPYPSAIDFGAITRTGGVNNTFYIWDSKINGGTTLGTYQTFSETNGFQCPLPNGSYTLGAVNTTIQSGQAFFVETSATPGTVSITEISKVASTGTTGYKLPGELVKIDSRLYSINATDTTMADANVVVFDSAYSNAVDGADASKFSNAGENLAVLRNTQSLVIEGRMPVNTADTIFFNMWNMKPQAYQLEFVPQNIGTQNLTARLEDSYLNTSTPVDLSTNTLVDFTVNATPASYASNRFRIVFAPSLVLPVSFQSISASRKASNVQVNWKLGIETNVTRYEVERSTDGSKFNIVGHVAATGASAYGFTDISAPSSSLFYRIRSIGTAGEVKYSSVVKVGAESSKPSFAVVPNPVEGSVVNIQFGNQAKGVYQLRLVNAMGQQVTTTSVSHQGGFATHSIGLPTAAARGTYQLEIIAPDKSSSFEQIFVNNTL